MSGSPQVKFLLTSVGRRVELVRHFSNAKAFRDGWLDIVGTEIDPTSPAAIALGDRVRIVPRFTDPAFPSAIERICREEGVTAVLPLIDPDVDVLSEAAADASWGGAPFASLPRNVAHLASDKWSTFVWLREHGVDTAETWLPDDVPEDANFPLFVKPRRGSGAIDTYKVRNEEELRFFAAYVADAIVQSFLGGPEVTVDVIVGARGEVLASVQRQRLLVRGGEVARGVTIHDPAITDVVTRLVQQLKPSGPVTVQGMYDGDAFKVTECNARMGGGLPLAVAAGVPVADLLARSWAGEYVEPMREYAIGVVMARFDDSFFVHP